MKFCTYIGHSKISMAEWICHVTSKWQMLKKFKQTKYEQMNFTITPPFEFKRLILLKEVKEGYLKKDKKNSCRMLKRHS